MLNKWRNLDSKTSKQRDVSYQQLTQMKYGAVSVSLLNKQFKPNSDFRATVS